MVMKMKIRTIENMKVEPNVYITEDAYREMRGLVDNCDVEIGWLGLSKKDGNRFVIYGVETCKQKCTGCHTELDENAMHDIYEKYKDKPDLLNDVRVWGHSHVDMEPTPSAQDDETFEEYYSTCDYFIMLIMNKKNKYTLHIADRSTGLVYEDLEFTILNSPKRQNIVDQINKLQDQLDEYDVERKKVFTEQAKKVVKEVVKRDNWYRGANWYTATTKTPKKKEEEKKDTVTYSTPDANDPYFAYYLRKTCDDNKEMASIRVGQSEKNIRTVLSLHEIIVASDCVDPKEVQYHFGNDKNFYDYDYEDWMDLIYVAQYVYSMALDEYEMAV